MTISLLDYPRQKRLDMALYLTNLAITGHRSSGICVLLVSSFGVRHSELVPLFHDWPEFSGVKEFPIAHGSMTPAEAFRLSGRLYGKLSRWSKHSPYGRARRRLCVYLAERLAAEQ